MNYTVLLPSGAMCPPGNSEGAETNPECFRVARHGSGKHTKREKQFGSTVTQPRQVRSAGFGYKKIVLPSGKMFTLLSAVLLLSSIAWGQSKVETIASIGARAADTAQTCYYMHTVPGWRERSLPTQSCAGIAGFNSGFALAAFFGDRWLTKHGHERLAHFQLVSAGGASLGIVYSTTHTRR